MKKHLSTYFLLLCISLPGFAQKSRPVPAKGNALKDPARMADTRMNMAPSKGKEIVLKDLENMADTRVNPEAYYLIRGFKKEKKLSGTNADTVVTGNAKGEKILLLYAGDQLSGVIFKTGSAAIIKNLLAESAAKYKLSDSVELVKSAGGNNYLQKRYAYIEKHQEDAAVADIPELLYTFTLIDAVKENGKDQYWIRLCRMPNPFYTNPASISMPQPVPGVPTAEQLAIFREDSIRVSQLINPGKVNPIAPGLLSRMDQFLLQHVFNDVYLPVQYISYGYTSAFIITPDNEASRSYTYTFNAAGQLATVSSWHQTTERFPNAKSDNLFQHDSKYDYAQWNQVGFRKHQYEIEYQQNVPVRIGDVTIDYNMDTVILFNSRLIRVYKMVNEMFLLVDEYERHTGSGKLRTILKDKQFTIEEKDGKVYHSCKNRKDNKPIFTHIYSASEWKLPFTVTAQTAGGANGSVIESYTKAQPDQLIRKTEEEKFTYIINNFELKGIEGGRVYSKPRE